MIREIKFRAWDKKRKKWADWIEVYSDGSYNIGYYEEGGGIIRPQWEDHYEHDIDLLKWNYKRDCVLMQNTGIKDKNGKEIYEGDIIINDKRKVGKIVKWNKEGSWNIRYFNSIHSWEIIGNMYEKREDNNE